MIMRIFILSCTVLAAMSPAASAQPDDFGLVGASADCWGNEVNLVVDWHDVDDPPADIVGWVVERQVMGLCVPNVPITEVLPLPTEPGSFEFADTPEYSSYPVIYRVWAVDGDGNREWIPWNQRGPFVHAVCPGVPAVRGVVTHFNNGFVWVPECPGQCWLDQSMLDSSLPGEELIWLTGQTVALFGEMKQGMHGHYVANLTGWEVVPEGCGPVPVSETTWSAVKGRFR